MNGEAVFLVGVGMLEVQFDIDQRPTTTAAQPGERRRWPPLSTAKPDLDQPGTLSTTSPPASWTKPRSFMMAILLRHPRLHVEGKHGVFAIGGLVERRQVGRSGHGVLRRHPGAPA